MLTPNLFNMFIIIQGGPIEMEWYTSPQYVDAITGISG